MIYLLKKGDRTATIITCKNDNQMMNYQKNIGSVLIENNNVDKDEAKNLVKELESLGYEHRTASFKYADKIVWYNNGKCHREDGPAMDFFNGIKKYFKHGEFHRVDGPAYINPLKDEEEWYLDGQLHRDDGPAIRKRGYNAWVKHGNYHRLDGPACKWPDGREQYWINGVQYYAGEDYWKGVEAVQSS